MTMAATMSEYTTNARELFSDYLTSDEMSQIPLVLCAWVGVITLHTIMNQLNIKKPSHSLAFEKAAHYIAIFSVVMFNLMLDSWYPNIGLAFASFKGPIGGYMLGLVDFYFSNLSYVRVSSCQKGLVLFIIPFCMAGAVITYLYGKSITVTTITDITIPSLLWAYVRLFVFIVCGGYSTDIFFNPLHRFEHASSSYKENHKHHHMYVKDLCGLVAYFGTSLDEFIMGVSIAAGLVVQFSIFEALGLFNGYVCTLMYYTFWCLATYSHSHNEALASLIVPVPESQNFIAYHRKHHVDPNSNMGAGVHGDMFWDWVLGQQSISKSA